MQVATVVKTGQVVGDHKFTDAHEVAGVFYGNRGVIGDGGKNLQVSVFENLFVRAINQFDDTQDTVLAAHRHAEHRLGYE